MSEIEVTNADLPNQEGTTSPQVDTIFIEVPMPPLDTFFMQEQQAITPPPDAPKEGKSMKERRALWDLMARN